jgi:hypothetical protein
MFSCFLHKVHNDKVIFLCPHVLSLKLPDRFKHFLYICNHLQKFCSVFYFDEVCDEMRNSGYSCVQFSLFLVY